MKKALMHAHTAYMVTQFNIDNIKILQGMGYQVDVACCWNDDDSALSKDAMKKARAKLDELGVKVIETASLRKATNVPELLESYRTLKNCIEKEKYDIVHTQSPIGGAICRMAARKARKKYGTKVIYAAHGFHFFEGAPKKNWILFYRVEKFCAKYTDLLITINSEDYKSAQAFNRCKVAYIHGAGVDLNKFSPSDDARNKVRQELKIADEAVVLLSVGELIPRKNHIEVLDALKLLKERNQIKEDQVKYLIAGRGKIAQELENAIVDRGLENVVSMLGFRSDVADIFAASDIYVFPSHQEGLPVALMEAMAVGMPCVASRIRGNVDLIEDGVGGILFDSKNHEDLAEKLQEMLEKNKNDWSNMGRINQQTMKKFDIETVNQEMKAIYEEIS